jgi:hypothetical protein
MKARFAQPSATPAEREFLLWLKITHPQIGHLMKRKNILHTRQPSEAEIQHAAYLLWIEDGRPEGRDLQHWLAARELLLHRHGRDTKTHHAAPGVSAPAMAAAASET